MKTTILKIGNIDYILGGGLGSWAKSYENKRHPLGTTRVIGGVLMYIYTTYPKWSCYEYNWCPVDQKLCHDFEKLWQWVNGTFV